MQQIPRLRLMGLALSALVAACSGGKQRSHDRAGTWPGETAPAPSAGAAQDDGAPPSTEPDPLTGVARRGPDIAQATPIDGGIGDGGIRDGGVRDAGTTDAGGGPRDGGVGGGDGGMPRPPGSPIPGPGPGSAPLPRDPAPARPIPVPPTSPTGPTR
jgi:hypothetical protein